MRLPAPFSIFCRPLARTALALLVLCCARPASASPVFETLGSTIGQGGFNAGVSSPGAAATYFNPALLPQAKQGLDLGWFVLHDSIGISLMARDRAVDIPESGLGRFGVGNPQPPLPTTWLENGCNPQTQGCSTQLPPRPRQAEGSSSTTRIYQSLGLVAHLLDEYIVAGLYTMIPFGAFTTGHAFFVDEREQFFSNSLHPELYGDRLDAISLAFGAGSQITDTFSIGLSFTLNLANDAVAQTYVGNSSDIPNTLLLSTEIEVLVGVAPHIGLNYAPIEGLSFSSTLHFPQKLEIDTAFGTFLPNGDLQVAARKSTHAWLPWTLVFGGQWDFVRGGAHTLGTAATVTFARFSQYLNRQSERPLPDYGWSDRWSGAVGLRHTHDERLRSFFDFTYVPSPVPAQTGRENYVDNDRFGLSAGTEYEWPIEAWDVAVKFGVNAQLHILPKRTQTKIDPSSPELAGGDYPQLVADEWADGTEDITTGQPIPESYGLQTNNPGWPGFSSQGLMVGGGLTLTLLY